MSHFDINLIFDIERIDEHDDSLSRALTLGVAANIRERFSLSIESAI